MNYAPATSKASKLPRLMLKAAVWFLAVVFLAGAGLWWFMNHGNGVRWAQKVIRERFPDVHPITPEQLNTRLQDPGLPRPVLIDARTPEEQSTSTLPGAILVSADAPAATVLQGLDPARPMVIYCASGYRGAVMARRLTEAGCTDVSNLEGGIFGWHNAGLPLEHNGIRVSEVHPYSSLFSRMLRKRQE